MKPSSLVCFVLFLLGILVALVQLWLHLWSDAIFIKIILTDAALFAVVLVWAFLVRENKESQKINNGNLLDS